DQALAANAAENGPTAVGATALSGRFASCRGQTIRGQAIWAVRYAIGVNFESAASAASSTAAASHCAHRTGRHRLGGLEEWKPPLPSVCASPVATVLARLRVVLGPAVRAVLDLVCLAVLARKDLLAQLPLERQVEAAEGPILGGARTWVCSIAHALD